MFLRWGHLAYRHRVLIPIVLVGAILALFLLEGTKLGDRLDQEGWDDPGSDSTRAANIEQEVFGRDASGDVILLVNAPEGSTVDDPALTQRVNDHMDSVLAQHPDNIAGMTSYFRDGHDQMISEDRQTAFISLEMAGVDNEVLQNFQAIEDTLPAEGIDMEIAGATPIAGALDSGMADDISRAELLGLPAVAILLLLVFGGVIAASMPLIVGVLSILGSMGILAIIAHFAQVNAFAQSVVTLLGLGLAIDYGLFMVSRFREELAEGRPVPDAVANTTATAGKTVVFSAAMVAVALSGLLIFPQAFLKSVAYGAISAVGLAALMSLVVLPALFGLLGPNIDKWSIRKAGRSREQAMNSLWARIPAWAMKRPKLVTAVIVIGLIGLTLPLTGVKFGGINETYLPPDNETRVSQERFDDGFPTMRTDPVKIVVEDNGNSGAVSQVVRQANDVEGLTGSFSVSRPTQDGVTVLSAGVENRDDNDRIVKELRDIDPGGDSDIWVGGTPAMEVESIEALFDKLPWMVIYMVVATFILMALVFGSVILPAKAIIMTTLSLGATLGILTLMFVTGVGSGLLGFTPGPLMSPVLVLIVAIIYGLSTDYEVFLVSRMVEDREEGASTEHAIQFGTASTGGIITAAAAIMIVVAAAFAFSDIVMMKYIAFGMITALILEATIVRMLLVPAVMKLLGNDCWWAPAWVKRLSERLGHNEGSPGGTADPVPAGTSDASAPSEQQLAGDGAGAGAGVGVGAVAGAGAGLRDGTDRSPEQDPVTGPEEAGEPAYPRQARWGDREGSTFSPDTGFGRVGDRAPARRSRPSRPTPPPPRDETSEGRRPATPAMDTPAYLGFSTGDGTDLAETAAAARAAAAAADEATTRPVNYPDEDQVEQLPAPRHRPHEDTTVTRGDVTDDGDRVYEAEIVDDDHTEEPRSRRATGGTGRRPGGREGYADKHGRSSGADRSSPGRAPQMSVRELQLRLEWERRAELERRSPENPDR